MSDLRIQRMEAGKGPTLLHHTMANQLIDELNALQDAETNPPEVFKVVYAGEKMVFDFNSSGGFVRVAAAKQADDGTWSITTVRALEDTSNVSDA